MKIEGRYRLNINHPDYNNFERDIRVKEKNDTIRFRVRLVPVKSQKITEVIVKAPGVPDTVFGSEKMHVQDFEVLKDGNIVLLTYDRTAKRGSVLRIFNGEKIITSVAVPGRARNLYQDYRGNIHVIRENGVMSFIVDDGKYFLSTMDLATFNNLLIPIQDSAQGKLFFSNFNELYPSFSYFLFQEKDSLYEMVRTVTDDLMMELYRSEYKYVDVRDKLWAKAKENETGIDAEIWIGAQFFTQSVYYKQLYAPLFLKDERLLYLTIIQILCMYMI